MPLKKEIARKTFNLVLLFFVVFAVLVAVYFYVSARMKYDALETSLEVIRDTIDGNGVLDSMRENISGFFGLFISQIVIFLVAVASLVFGLWFVTRLYFIEYRSALIDPLMGIYNRKAILFVLEKEMKRSVRFGHPISVAMIDIDFFKKYNDTLGHVAGDRLLKRIARVLKKGLRDIDYVGRFGGEEFLAVFPETGLDRAAKVGERLRKKVEETKFYGESELPMKKVTISIGLADLSGKRRVKKEAFIHDADENLYKAKSLGRNVLVAR
jgi:diguanylate cyclase (GGDEF)-like protein